MSRPERDSGVSTSRRSLASRAPGRPTSSRCCRRLRERHADADAPRERAGRGPRRARSTRRAARRDASCTAASTAAHVPSSAASPRHRPQEVSGTAPSVHADTYGQMAGNARAGPFLKDTDSTRLREGPASAASATRRRSQFRPRPRRNLTRARALPPLRQKARGELRDRSLRIAPKRGAEAVRRRGAAPLLRRPANTRSRAHRLLRAFALKEGSAGSGADMPAAAARASGWRTPTRAASCSVAPIQARST